MADKYNNSVVDELANGYEQMLERAVSDFYHTEQETELQLHTLIGAARDKAVELGELSKQEAQELAEYVKRDVSHFLEYMSDAKRDLTQWLGFETALLESSILDILLKAANATTVDTLLRNSMADSNREYRAGDITGPGTLVCRKCRHPLQMRKTGEIPACSKCQGLTFERQLV